MYVMLAISMLYQQLNALERGHARRQWESDIRTCQAPEYKNRETSRNLQGQPAKPCQQQRRASEGCGIKAIFRASVGKGVFTLSP